MLKKCFFLLFLTFYPFYTFTATQTFTKTSGGPYNWNKNANWNPNTSYPQTTEDKAIINNNGNLNINLSDSISLQNITLNNQVGSATTNAILDPNNKNITFAADQENISLIQNLSGKQYLHIEPTILLDEGNHTFLLQGPDEVLEINTLNGPTNGNATLLITSTGQRNVTKWSGGGSGNLESITFELETPSDFIIEKIPESSPTINLFTSGSLTINNAGSGTFSGDVAGGGAINIQSESNYELIFSGNITNNGPISISGGSVTFNSVPQTSIFDLDPNPYTDAGTLTLNLDTDATYSGSIKTTNGGVGYLRKKGSGTLTLSAQFEDSSMAFDIDQGKIIFETIPIAAGYALSNSSIAEFSISPGVKTISSPILGTGSFIKSGEGTLQLSSNLMGYTGNTSITNGTLSLIQSLTQSPQISISADKTLQFSPVSKDTQTYGGRITGAGDVVMNGEGIQILSGSTLDYTGTTTVSSGTLHINSSTSVTASNFDVNSGSNPASSATLRGEGSISGNLVVTKGSVHAGPGADSVFTVGPYTQSASGNLKVTLERFSSAKLAVEGDAALGGTFEPVFSSGTYPKDSTYTVLTATGSLNNTTFNQMITPDIGSWEIIYLNDNTIQIATSTGAHFLPYPTNTLSSNEQKVANYMYPDVGFVQFDTDLLEVSHAINVLTQPDYGEAYLRISPIAYAAINNSLFYSDVQVAQTFNSSSGLASASALSDFASYRESEVSVPYLIAEKTTESPGADDLIDSQVESNDSYSQYVLSSNQNENEPSRLAIPFSKVHKESPPCFATVDSGPFLEPIGLYYHQREREGQVPFDLGTYGAGAGWTLVCGQHFFLTGGLGYTHSNLAWKQHYGNSKWSSLYAAPIFGWFFKHAFVNVTAMGVINFVKTDRKIYFPGIDRVALSRYKAYDFLVRANAGARIPWFRFMERLWFQPEVTVNGLSIFTESFTEKGAGGINLKVKRRTNYFIQPSLRCKLIKEFLSAKTCYAPALFVGWLANVPINPDNFTARFTGSPNRSLFNISGYNLTTNQLILGASFLMKRDDKFKLQSDFELDMLSRYEIYNFKVSFQWIF
ncbi:MAG: hypothetical protein S4CHLAM7_13340 [Chlamydiae bacterium]|nr:hypothetical protein [Chlamydiota bacterium]